MKLPKEFIIVTSVVCTLLGISACSPTLEPVPTNYKSSTEPQVHQQQTLVLINSPTLTKTPTLAKTPLPSKTFAPTNTPIPTGTFTPTITPTPFQLPFVDEFNTGIRPEWTIFGDIPTIVDQTLTTNDSTTMSIGLGDPTLTDYIVDFKAEYWGGYSQFIGIRAQDEGNMIAVGADRDAGSTDVYIYIVNNGNWQKLPESRFKFGSIENIHVVISIKGNHLLVTYGNARTRLTKEVYFSEPYIKYGGVIFKFLNSHNYWDNDVIDFIRILPNP